MEHNLGKLWEKGPEGLSRFNEIRIVEPMEKALKEFKATAWLTGLRAYQTSHRASLKIVERRKDGVYKIHPFFKWTEEQVEAYFKQLHLPHHPLVAQGYRSIGNFKHLTQKGTGREGRQFGRKDLECGLHTHQPKP